MFVGFQKGWGAEEEGEDGRPKTPAPTMIMEFGTLGGWADGWMVCTILAIRMGGWTK